MGEGGRVLARVPPELLAAAEDKLEQAAALKELRALWTTPDGAWCALKDVFADRRRTVQIDEVERVSRESTQRSKEVRATSALLATSDSFFHQVLWRRGLAVEIGAVDQKASAFTLGPTEHDVGDYANFGAIRRFVAELGGMITTLETGSGGAQAAGQPPSSSSVDGVSLASELEDKKRKLEMARVLGEIMRVAEHYAKRPRGLVELIDAPYQAAASEPFQAATLDLKLLNEYIGKAQGYSGPGEIAPVNDWRLQQGLAVQAGVEAVKKVRARADVKDVAMLEPEPLQKLLEEVRHGALRHLRPDAYAGIHIEGHGTFDVFAMKDAAEACKVLEGFLKDFAGKTASPHPAPCTLEGCLKDLAGAPAAHRSDEQAAVAWRHAPPPSPRVLRVASLGRWRWVRGGGACAPLPSRALCVGPWRSLCIPAAL